MKKSLFFLFLLCFFQADATISFQIEPDQARSIGEKIWYNECKGTIDGLTSWNPGEEFASLGIGHFIWHPKETTAPFNQTFPSLLTYLEKHGKKLPSWLKKDSHCPWRTRHEFIQAQRSKRMHELRVFLLDTVDLQAQFIIENLEQSLTKCATKLSPKKYALIKKQFYRIAESPNGLYALIDYANFKGIGFDAKETYNNQGWGLIQVLEDLKGTKPGKQALEEFASSAKKILAQRIQNAPPQRNEQRWFEGWCNRIKTYC